MSTHRQSGKYAAAGMSSPSEGVTPPPACCASVLLSACCAPQAKATCCGPSPQPATCGCQPTNIEGS